MDSNPFIRLVDGYKMIHIFDFSLNNEKKQSKRFRVFVPRDKDDKSNLLKDLGCDIMNSELLREEYCRKAIAMRRQPKVVHFVRNGKTAY